MDPDLEREKELAARAAVRRVRRGMHLALGTGSTTAYAVRALAESFPGGTGSPAVASSVATETLARELRIEVRRLEPTDRFDIMLDGADEVTPEFDLTKGGGGALLREKLLARLSKELVIMVDHTKLVQRLAERAPIPVEVVPFARPVVAHRLAERGHQVDLRTEVGSQSPWTTDNGNEILDIRPSRPIESPVDFDVELRTLPGVVETGIFAAMADRVFVGLSDGSVKELLPGARKTGRPA